MKTIASFALLSVLGSGVRAQEAPAPTPTPAATPAPASAPPDAPATATNPAAAPEAQAEAGTAGDFKIAGVDVPAPSRKKYVAPEYPAAAAAEGIRGIVILEVMIKEDGKVESTKVTRSIPGLDEAAMNAVRQWEYEPTKAAGKAVRVRLSQSITFALKLPVIERAAGIPELKSGGAPPIPADLESAQTASVMIALGAQGEVREAAVVEGSPAVSEALLRVVRQWRFTVPEGSPPLIFTVRADWAPGPPPALTLKAMNPRAIASSSAPAATHPPAATAPPPTEAAPVPSQPAPPQTQAAPAPTGAPATPPAPQGQTAPPPVAPAGAAGAAPNAPPPPDPTPQAPAVETDVLPAREEPPAKEEGISAISDVVLGENIPDLVRGRRPTWPPLARLGNVSGDVVVRFSVDLAGRVTVHSAEGPDLLKPAAEQAVGTWVFRRTAITRLNLIATFKFGNDRATARIDRAGP